MGVDLKDIYTNDVLLEVGRKAIEDVLVEWRDGCMSQIRGNGLVIRSRTGESSSVIRLGPEDALRIGLKAIDQHLQKASEKNGAAQ